MLVQNVNKHVAIARALFADRTNGPDAIESATRLLDCDVVEWKVYKDGVALAHAQDEIGLDDALALQAILGASPEHFNRQDLASKYVLSGLMAKLLDWKTKLTLARA